LLDLDAYLERIGLSGRPSLAEVHRAHATSIPFENLDSHAGLPVSVEEADVAGKLVGARRGGYCFEQNVLLRAALLELGADVEMFLARVRLGALPGTIRPRSHLVLRVRDGAGGDWLADVGFGSGTQLEPIPFALGVETRQAGWSYRLREDGAEWVLQSVLDGDWTDVHGFVPLAAAPIDIVVANWWVCTHPGSPFVTGLIVGVQDQEGRRVVLNDWSGELTLLETTPAGTELTSVEQDDIPALLAQRFSLPGFELDSEGRVRRSG
jgi:N-hydroxyarylamine O-acetyltransferase